MRNKDQGTGARPCLLGFGLASLFIFLGSGSAQAQTEPSKSFLPGLLICGNAKNTLVHVNSHGKLDWDYDLDGPILDVQTQPSEHYLVTGGSKNVSLLRKVWKGCRTLWDWGELPDVSIQSAVATAWDEQGDPTLVLAADAKTPRLILAEAKTKAVKIRWEYKLPAVPLSAKLCPDSGNFLAVLSNSTLMEILYQEDKVVWSLGPEDGLKDVRDAARGPWGHTYVAQGDGGSILCFDPHKNLVWKTHLPFAPSASFQEGGISVFKKNGKRVVMISIHWPGGASKNVVYLLNAETGKVLNWSDRSDKGVYPSFHRVVPDLVLSGHKS